MEVQFVVCFFFPPFVMLSIEKQAMPEDHKDQSGAQSVENAVKTETKCHPTMGEDLKPIQPNILFSRVAITDIYKKRIRNSSKRK